MPGSNAGQKVVDMTKKSPPTVLSEVTEIINLPEFDPAAYHSSIESQPVTLDPEVVSQLKTYVSRIAAMYEKVRQKGN